MNLAVEMRDVYWRYPSFVGAENPWSIKGVTLTVEKGEVFGITGPSGAGKTTLCRLIMGVLPFGTKLPFQQINYHIRGTVKVLDEVLMHVIESANVVDGVALGKLEGKETLSPRIGMVMQDPENQFLQMSLLHELAFGLSLQSVPPEEIRQRAKLALDMVGLGQLWENAEYIHPLDLSGGQKQRVAIAAFLSLNPEVLVLDEPTSDLDPLGKLEIIQTVRKLKEEQGMTIILVEHDPELLYTFCDRIALIDHGEIVTIEEAKKFYTQIDLLEKHGVAPFEATRIAKAANIDFGNSIPVTNDELIPLIRPSSIKLPARSSLITEDQPVIRVKDMHFQYPDGTEALKGAELTVWKGEMVALLGINGSGKTTLAKILAGINPPGAGRAEVFGKDLSDRRVRRDLPKWIGYVFQNPDHQIFTRKVFDEVAYGLANLQVPLKEREAIIERTLEMVGLADFVNEDPLFLGKGQRQRLAVASVLAMGPEILIVDEPTTGQDFHMINGIMALMEELHRQNKTFLIITHDMSLVANYCDRAIVMLDGKTAFDGSPRDLFVDADLLSRTHLRSPQAVQLSLAFRKTCQDFPILLNLKEWTKALSATTPMG